MFEGGIDQIANVSGSCSPVINKFQCIFDGQLTIKNLCYFHGQK